MSENLLTGIIATIVAVVLLGMPFWLFGGKKNVGWGDSVPGEEQQPVNAQELSVIRKMLLELLSVNIVFGESAHCCIESMITGWKPGRTCSDLTKEFFNAVKLSPLPDLPKLKMLLTQQKEALETIGNMKGLDALMVDNIRICRICNNCLMNIFEEEKF